MWNFAGSCDPRRARCQHDVIAAGDDRLDGDTAQEIGKNVADRRRFVRCANLTIERQQIEIHLAFNQLASIGAQSSFNETAPARNVIVRASGWPQFVTVGFVIVRGSHLGAAEPATGIARAMRAVPKILVGVHDRGITISFDSGA